MARPLFVSLIMLLVSELVPITRQYPSFLKHSECRWEMQLLDCSGTGIIALPNYSSLWSPKMDSLNPRTVIRSMRHINLSNNAISELHLGVFYNFSQLEMLNVNDNHIITVFFNMNHKRNARNNSEDFLQSLKTLLLERNKLSAIPRGFGRLQSLQTLSLAGNKISQIQQDDFENCTKLKRIDLGSNAIYKIHPNAFSDITELQVLKLNSNALVTITPMAFLYIHMLQAEIDLSNNPWACDCGIISSERLSSLLPKDLMKQWDLTCSTPTSRTLQRLLATDDSHYTCDLLIDDSVFIKGIILPAGETAILHCDLPGTLGNQRTFWWTPQGVVSEEHHDPHCYMNKEKNLLLHYPGHSEEGLYVCFSNGIQRQTAYQVYVQQDISQVLRRSPRYIETRNTRMRTEGDFALAVSLSVIITFLCSFCLGLFLRPLFEKLWRKHCKKKTKKDQPSDIVYENTGYTEDIASEGNFSSTDVNNCLPGRLTQQNEISLGQGLVVHEYDIAEAGTSSNETTVVIKPLRYPKFVMANDGFRRPNIVKSKKKKHLFPKDNSKISQHPTLVKEGITDTEEHTNKADVMHKNETDDQTSAQDSICVNAPQRHKEKVYAYSSDSELSLSDDGSLFSFSLSNSLSGGSETLEMHSDNDDNDSLHKYRSDGSDGGETHLKPDSASLPMQDTADQFHVPFVRFYDKRDIGKKLNLFYCQTSNKKTGNDYDEPIVPTMDGKDSNNTDVLKTTSEEETTPYESKSDDSDYKNNLQSSKHWQHWSGRLNALQPTSAVVDDNDGEDLLSSPALQSTYITNADQTKPIISFHDKLDIGKKLTFFYHEASAKSTEDVIDGTIVPAVDSDSNKNDSIIQWLDDITEKIGELQLPLNTAGLARRDEESSISDEDIYSFSSSQGQSENITIKQDYGTDHSDAEMYLQPNNYGQNWRDNQNLLHDSLDQNILQNDHRTTHNGQPFYPSSSQPANSDENNYGTVRFYDKLDIGKNLKFISHETLLGSAVNGMDKPMIVPVRGHLNKSGDTDSWVEMCVDKDVTSKSQLPFFASGGGNYFTNDAESTSSDDEFSYPSSPEPDSSTNIIKQQGMQDYGTDDSDAELQSNNDGQDWPDNKNLLHSSLDQNILQDDKNLLYPSLSQLPNINENNYVTVCFYDKLDIGKKLKFVSHKTLRGSAVDVINKPMIFPLSGIDIKTAGDTASWVEMCVDENVTNERAANVMDKPMIFPVGAIDLNKVGNTDSWVEMYVDEDVTGESQLPLFTSGDGNYCTSDDESSTSSEDHFSYPSSPEHYDYSLQDYKDKDDIFVRFSDKMEIGEKLCFFVENKLTHHIEDLDLPPILEPNYTVGDDQNIDDVLVCFADKMEIGKKLCFNYKGKPTLIMKEVHPPLVLQPIYTPLENKSNDDTAVCFSDKMHIGNKLRFYYKSKPAIPKKCFIPLPVLKSDYTLDDVKKDNTLVCFSDKMNIGKKLTFLYEDETWLPHADFTSFPALKADFTLPGYKNKDDVVVRFSDKMHIGKRLTFYYKNKPAIPKKDFILSPVLRSDHIQDGIDNKDNTLVCFSDKIHIGKKLRFFYGDETVPPHVDFISIPILKADDTLPGYKNKDDVVVRFSDKMHIGKRLTFYYKNKPAIPKKDFILPPVLRSNHIQDGINNKDNNTLVRFSDKMHIGKKLRFFYRDETVPPHVDFISIPVLKADYTLPGYKNKDDVVVRFSDKIHIGKQLSFFYVNKPTHHRDDLDLPLVVQPSYKIHDDQNIDDVLVCFADKMAIGKKLNLIYESKPTLTAQELHPPPVLQPMYTLDENESKYDPVVCFTDKMNIGKKLTFYYENKPTTPNVDFISQPAFKSDYTLDASENGDDPVVRFSDKIDIGRKLRFYCENISTVPNVDFISQPVLKSESAVDVSEDRDETVVCFSDKMHIGKKLTFYYKSKPAIPKKDFLFPPVLKSDYTQDDTLVRFSDKMHIGEKLTFFYDDDTGLPHADFISIPILKADCTLQNYKKKNDIVVRFSDKMEIGKKLSFYYENIYHIEDLEIPLALQPNYTIDDDDDNENIDDVLVCFSDKMGIGKRLHFITENKPTVIMKELHPPPVLQPIYTLYENESKDPVVRFSDKMNIGRKLTFYYEDKPTTPKVDFISRPVLKSDYTLDNSENRDYTVVRFSDKMHIGKKFTFYYKSKPAIPKKDFLFPPVFNSDYKWEDSKNKDLTLVKFSDKMHIGKKFTFFYEEKTVLPCADVISIPVVIKDYKNKDDNIVVCFSDEMEIGKKLGFFYEYEPTHRREGVGLPLVLQPSYTIHDEQNIDDVLVCFADKMEIGKKLNLIYESKPALTAQELHLPPVVQPIYTLYENKSKGKTTVRFSDKMDIGKKLTFYYENKPTPPNVDSVLQPVLKSDYTLDNSRQTVYEIPDFGETSTDDLIDFTTETSHLINSPPKGIILEDSGQYFTKRKRVFDAFSVSDV